MRGAVRSPREVAAGAVYATLDRLEEKSLISSRLGAGTAARCSLRWPTTTFWLHSLFTARFVDAIKAGVIVGAMTHVVFYLTALVRVNLFVDSISQRPDWQNLEAWWAN